MTASDRTTVEGEPATLSSPPAECFTRGLNVRAALSWVKRNHGADGVALVLSAMSAADRVALGGGRPVPSVWVPFLAHARLLASIDVVLGAGDGTLLRHVGRFMARRDFPLIARPLLRLMSPGYFIDRGMSLWRLYHSTGRWEMTRTDGELGAVLLDHADAHPAFCAAFCGWFEGALSLTGAVDPRCEELSCAARGDGRCSMRATWRRKRSARDTLDDSTTSLRSR